MPAGLELVEDRVQGPMVEAERAVAAVLDLEGELVAVPGPVAQRREDQGLMAASREMLCLEDGVLHGTSFDCFRVKVRFSIYRKAIYRTSI